MKNKSPEKINRMSHWQPSGSAETESHGSCEVTEELKLKQQQRCELRESRDHQRHFTSLWNKCWLVDWMHGLLGHIPVAVQWSQWPITVKDAQWQQGITPAWSDGRFSTVAVVAVDPYSLRQWSLQRLHSVVVLHSQWALQPLASVEAPGAAVLSQLVEATQARSVSHAHAEWLPVGEGADLPVVAAVSHLLVTWDRRGRGLVSYDFEVKRWNQLATQPKGKEREIGWLWLC